MPGVMTGATPGAAPGAGRQAAVDSRLDRMIARLMTQRVQLAWAAAAIRGVPGAIFDIGLGKGRTYSHLATILTGREIYSFDRDVHAPPAATPPADHLFLGELSETLPAAAARFAGSVALVHADIGTERPERDLPLAQFIGAHGGVLLAKGGVMLADRDMSVQGAPPPGLETVPPRPAALPDGIAAWPYFLYRKP
jgi:hypothetical protein